jgi:hypothetical protein
MKRKTIIFVCNNKGGIGKSTTAAYVGDALKSIGYSVLFLSGDQTTNIVLKTLQPTTRHFYIRNIGEVDEAMKIAMAATEDVIIFDLPGDSSPDAANYFAGQGFQVFREAGLRLVLAITAVQHKDSVVGGIQWFETFFDNAEVILFANGSRTPENEPIDLTKIDGGSDLLELAEGRMIEVPRFKKELLDLYSTNPAVPTSYFPDGEMGKKLGMDMIKTNRWRQLHQAIVRSVMKHAEWLTGKPIPSPLEPVQNDIDAPKNNTVLDRLKLKYVDALSGGQTKVTTSGNKKPKTTE